MSILPKWLTENVKFVVSLVTEANIESLCDNLAINTVFIIVPSMYSGASKSSDDQSGDFFGLLCALALLNRKYLWMLLSDWVRFKSLHIYMDMAITVVIAFALLIVINLQYRVLVPFPISLVGFIVYLCKEEKLQHGSGSEDKDSIVEAPTSPSRSMDELEMTVVIPYFMLLISAIYGDGRPVVSHFLLFSCCALGTLALMYSRLPDEVNSSWKSALECIQMAYLVMLFITAHTVAAEWLGEVTALVCMPKLIAGLLWFSTLLHSDTSKGTVQWITSDKDGSMFVPVFGAILAGLITSTYAYEGELLAFWNTKATIACCIAGCMPYLSAWMISRWPGDIPSSDKVTQLLKFPANICLAAACLMLLALLAEKTLAYRLFGLNDLIDPKYLPGIYFSTAVALWFPKLYNTSIAAQATPPQRRGETDLVVGAMSGMVALLWKLNELLHALRGQEYALLRDVRAGVAFLKTELGSMCDDIHRYEELERPDSLTGTWIYLVRELAYDIEDWVDLFAIRVDAGGGAAASGGPPASNSSRILGWFRRGADKELKDIKERVIKLSKQRERYRVDLLAGAAKHRPVDPRMPTPYAEAGSLVGLDGQVEELSKILMDAGSRKLKFISISGMAGSGKTTLANVVFQRLRKSFECSAFVSMGQEPDIAGTLEDMLAQLDGWHRGRGAEDPNQLIGRLRETLEQKRYLIVIDDLWPIYGWGFMKRFLEENNRGSRVIITTRNDTLAAECSSGSNGFVHKIELLDDFYDRILFLEKAFANGCPRHLEHLEDVFAQIMRRCGGLPLAVVSIAKKLENQPMEYWERLRINSICNSDPDGVKQILNLSYSILESELKICLLYLSIFPENYEIDTDRLVRRWIAEGFITEDGWVRTADLATAIVCLNELISENLVQPLELSHDDIPRRCKVHPVIHDFIVCKSMEGDFATLMDAQHVPNNPYSTVRRLSLKNSSKQDQPTARNESMDLSHARSITVFGHASAVPQLTNLKVVRVLDLEGCDGEVCLDGLCKLVLLRYLSLKGTAVSELPAAIGDLMCLETLDVRSTKVEQLPPSIVRLKNLMHLLAGSAKLPGGIAEMEALRTLSCGGTTKSSVNFIEEISKHDALMELELYSDDTEMLGNKKGVMFPANGFHSVKKLCIRQSSPLVTFEPRALPAIQVLELRFQKGLADESSGVRLIQKVHRTILKKNESSGVSGMENLSSLKCVLLDFEQHDAGAMVTVDAVRNAARILPYYPYIDITIKVDGESY